MCKMPCSWDSRRPAPQHSPMVKSNGCRLGLPLAAIWLLGKLQDLKFAIQDKVYG